MFKPGFMQAGFVRFDRIGQHDVFQHAALLADFQLAVAVGTLKVVMHVEQQFANMRIFETEFFGQHQRAPDSAPDKPYPEWPGVHRGQKLNGEVQHHHGGVVDGDITNIAFHNLDRRRRFISMWRRQRSTIAELSTATILQPGGQCYAG
jgi:hypothetical protein